MHPRAIERRGWDTYQYDLENRQTSVETEDGITTFTYNALGERVRTETEDGTTTEFLYDGVNLRQESDSGVVEADYTVAPQPQVQPFGDLVSQNRAGESLFYHFDALGSTAAISDSTQTTTDQYVYEAFGKLISDTGTTINPYGYVGRLGYYYDVETGLYRLGERIYDPITGRFTTQDRIGFASGESDFYRAFGNNPVNDVDPSGQAEITLDSLREVDFKVQYAVLSELSEQQLRDLELKAGEFEKYWRPANVEKTIEIFSELVDSPTASVTSDELGDLNRAWNLMRHYDSRAHELPSSPFYALPYTMVNGRVNTNIRPPVYDSVKEFDKVRDRIRAEIRNVSQETIEFFIEAEASYRESVLRDIKSIRDVRKARATVRVVGAVVPSVGLASAALDFAEDPNPITAAGLIPIPGGKPGGAPSGVAKASAAEAKLLLEAEKKAATEARILLEAEKKAAAEAKTLADAEANIVSNVAPSTGRPITPGTGSEPIIAPGAHSPVPGPVGARPAPNRHTATLGKAASNDYKATFFKAHPELEGGVIVHHVIEQQILTKFPGVVTEAEIHSLQNLRGVPKSINSELHLSQIRVEWNRFYKPFVESRTSPTKAQLLEKATEIDLKFGSRFTPSVGGQ